MAGLKTYLVTPDFYNGSDENQFFASATSHLEAIRHVAEQLEADISRWTGKADGTIGDDVWTAQELPSKQQPGGVIQWDCIMTRFYKAER